MGFVSSTLRLANLNGGSWAEVEAIVDTGATYTVAPGRLLRELGIEPLRTSQVELADGSVREYQRGEARVTIDGSSAVTPVIFGEDDAELLIGVVTLEELELAIDPIGERLIPVQFIRI